jgi:subtilisin family serine protease
MADARKKLNPMLRALADDAREVERARGLAHPDASGPPPDLVDVSVELEGDDLRPLERAGLKPTGRIGRFIHGRILAERLAELAALPAVVRVRRIERDHIMLNKSIRECRADGVRTWDGASGTWHGLTGSGVIVGVIDTGIDFRHGAFRNPDGTSRILFLWDQSIEPDPKSVETSPHIGGEKSYGVEYTKSLIDAVLLNQPGAMPVREEDTDGHGTHVAGIAAGDGSERERCGHPFEYAGVAPEADLIIVKAGWFGPSGRGDTLLAAQYILEKAGELVKPAVINISLGDHRGPHDGTGDESELNFLLAPQVPPRMLRAIVVAAGNERQDKLHVKGTVPAGVGRDLTINFRIPSEVKEDFWLDFWYPATGAGSGQLQAVVVAPNGRATDQTTAGGSNDKALTLPDGSRIRVFSELPSDENANLNQIFVRVKPTAGKNLPAGPWQLRLKNATPDAVQFDAWLAEIEKPAKFVDAGLISEDTTITGYASARNIIAVANYRSRGSVGELAPSSSRGPRRGATTADKPEITAPGTTITAPGDDNPSAIKRCCTACCRHRYRDLEGTSMAAPHVAGAIALMLDAKPDLRMTEIRDLLRNTARKDAQTGPTPNTDWGAGKLDVEALVNAVLAMPLAPPAGAVVASAAGSGAQRRGAVRRRVRPSGAMHVLHERLLVTERGCTYADLVERHFEEVYALINGNKRVATVWHRNCGPALVSHAMSAASQPSTPLPAMIQSETLRHRLERILAMLKRYGSTRLAEDIDAHWEAIATFEGLSIDQILTRLETGAG